MNNVIKPKKCKCPCGEKFIPRTSLDKWINHEHYKRWLTETPEGEKEIARKAAKAKKDVQKAEKAKIDSWKPTAKEKEYKADFQREINKLSRMIDAKFGYNTCIDCDKPFGAQTDAAHYNGVGSNNSIRYNLHNLHSAKSDCNQFSDKHKQGYEIGLQKRYGEDYFKLVQELPIKYKYIKVTPIEVFEKLKIVRGIIRHFDTYQAENAIAMREMFNNVIGIY